MAAKTEVIKAEHIALEHFIPEKILQDTKILFIHSSGHGSWLWHNFLAYFAARGYDSWALNLRGHYLAPPVANWADVGSDAYLEDINQAVKLTGKNVVLVGHSMTGVLILKYAESHDVAGLIVSQSGLPGPTMKKRGIEIQRPKPPKGKRMMTETAILPMKDRAMVEAILFDKGNVDEASIQLVLEKLGEESLRAAKEIAALPVEPAKITEPVFVLGFDAAKLGMKTSVDMGKVLAEEFNARDYTVIEPGGHNYMLEKNWQSFARQFQVWIESIRP